jgi:hypothetical protein
MQQHWQIKVMHQQVAWHGESGWPLQEIRVHVLSEVTTFQSYKSYTISISYSPIPFYMFKSCPWIAGLVCSSFCRVKSRVLLKSPSSIEKPPFLVGEKRPFCAGQHALMLNHVNPPCFLV